MLLSTFAQPTIPKVPLRIFLEKKSSTGKFPCNLLESRRLRARKLKLLPVVEKVLVAVKVVDVETLVAVGDAGAAVAVVGAVGAVA